MGPQGRGTPRAPRGDGARGHPHRHAGQGAGRRQRRLHQRPQGDHRTAAPAVAAVSVLQHARAAHCRRLAEVLSNCCTASTELRDRLEDNTRFFREEIVKAGLDVLPGEHPIVPIMLGDAALAARIADAMLGARAST